MVLTTCKTCGKRISATAQNCPYCTKMPIWVKCEAAVVAILLTTLMMVAGQVPRYPTAKQIAEQEAAALAAGALINIPQLAGKNQAEVEALLGEAVFCAQSESNLNCTYQENEIEIVFIDGKADWISIYGTFRSAPYSQQLKGKEKAEVLKLFGDPMYCAKAKAALRCAFRDGDVGVEFIGDKIDEVTVKGRLGKAAFGKETLALLGLPAKEPTFANKHVLRWENIPGLVGLTMRSEDNIVALVTVKVKTK